MYYTILVVPAIRIIIIHSMDEKKNQKYLWDITSNDLCVGSFIEKKIISIHHDIMVV